MLSESLFKHWIDVFWFSNAWESSRSFDWLTAEGSTWREQKKSWLDRESFPSHAGSSHIISLKCHLLFSPSPFMKTIYKNHLVSEKYDEIKFIEDLIMFGTYSCDSITIYLQYINSIVQVKDDQTEIMQLLKELSCNNEELKIFLKKVEFISLSLILTNRWTIFKQQ